MPNVERNRRRSALYAKRQKAARNAAAMWQSDCYFARIGQPGRTSTLDAPLQTVAAARKVSDIPDPFSLNARPTANKSAKATYKF